MDNYQIVVAAEQPDRRTSKKTGSGVDVGITSSMGTNSQSHSLTFERRKRTSVKHPKNRPENL